MLTKMKSLGFFKPTADQVDSLLGYRGAECSPVEVDRRFRGVYCLHHQGDESALYPRKLSITFLLAAVRILNLKLQIIWEQIRSVKIKSL
jgi:hypothetical protein